MESHKRTRTLTVAERMRGRRPGRYAWTRRAGLAFLFVAGLVLVAVVHPGGAGAQTAPSLGTASSFGVLGGSTVTNTGSTSVMGNVGVSPGTAITGFPPGTLTGALHANDAVAQQAQLDSAAAFGALDQPCDATLTGQDLGGMTLTEGVYCFATAAQLTGNLTLDGGGATDSVFIFTMGSTLTTASNASVQFVNGAQACNVFWRVGSSATLGTGTSFAGNILALASITLNTGASVDGRALAQTGAVTMDTNVIAASGCVAPTATPTGTTGATVSPTASSTAVSPTASSTVASPTASSTTVVSPTASSTAVSPTASSTAVSPTTTPTTQTPVATPTSTATSPAGGATQVGSPTATLTAGGAQSGTPIAPVTGSGPSSGSSSWAFPSVLFAVVALAAGLAGAAILAGRRR